MPSDKYPKYAYFPLFPDKAVAGSRHLSGESFKAYWLVLWWMWLNGPDQCTMPDTTASWVMATGLPQAVVRKVRAEIMSPAFPLLKKQGNMLISGGLQKCVVQLRKLSDAQRDKVNKRWAKASGDTPGDTAVIPGNTAVIQSKLETKLEIKEGPFGATPKEAYGFNSIELQYLKAMPGLKDLVDKCDIETIKAVIHGVQVLKVKWPQVFMFINKALAEKVPVLTISGALQACLARTKAPEDWRPFFQACIHRHGKEITEKEWDRLWPEIKAGRGSPQGIGVILERLGFGGG